MTGRLTSLRDVQDTIAHCNGYLSKLTRGHAPDCRCPLCPAVACLDDCAFHLEQADKMDADGIPLVCDRCARNPCTEACNCIVFVPFV